MAKAYPGRKRRDPIKRRSSPAKQAHLSQQRATPTQRRPNHTKKDPTPDSGPAKRPYQRRPYQRRPYQRSPLQKDQQRKPLGLDKKVPPSQEMRGNRHALAWRRCSRAQPASLSLVFLNWGWVGGFGRGGGAGGRVWWGEALDRCVTLLVLSD